METSKFEIGDLLGIGMTLVILGIGLSYGLDIMDDNREGFCEGSYQHYLNGHCYTCDATNTTWISANLSCSNGGTVPAVSYVVGTTDSLTLNASTDAITGISKIPEKLPTIVTVIVAAVIIGILVRYLWRGAVGGK